ncbi:MAG: glycosyltransferase, partial [Pirellulales bacterium]|nr:glycosyltransferase [Pirellulales bacterium]
MLETYMDYDNDVCSGTNWPPGQVLVQTATYNEKGNIAALIEAVLKEVPEAQILVIDDQSPDGTGDIVQEMAIHDQRVHLLGRRDRRGLGSAILEGLQTAKSKAFDIAVYMDADFSHDPKDIPRLLEAMGQENEKTFDIAIGSRRVQGGGTVGWPL